MTEKHGLPREKQFQGGATTRIPRAGPVKITHADGTVEYQRALTYRERRDRGSANRSHIIHEMKQAIFERDQGRCQSCRTDKGPFHVDHIRPYSKGGWNVLSNLQLLCASCNLSKGATWKKATTNVG